MSHHGEVDEGDISHFRRPNTLEITHDQLVNEVKGIYAGLVMVEKKCVEIDLQQSQSNTKLSVEQWQALTTLHRTLLHEHHDFFLASHRPTASDAMKRLATKYAIPAHMWRHGIHSILDLLRTQGSDSLEFVLTFVYFAYSRTALLTESVPFSSDTWIECTGDLARYRMAIEEADLRHHGILSGVTTDLYKRAAEFSSFRRLQHPLAIWARPSIVQQFFYYDKASSSHNGSARAFLEDNLELASIIDTGGTYCARPLVPQGQKLSSRSIAVPSSEPHPAFGTLMNGLKKFPGHDPQLFDPGALRASKTESTSVVHEAPSPRSSKLFADWLWRYIRRMWAFIFNACLDATATTWHTVSLYLNRRARRFLKSKRWRKMCRSYEMCLQPRLLVPLLLMTGHASTANAESGLPNLPRTTGNEPHEVLGWFVVASLAILVNFAVYYIARRQRGRRLYAHARVTRIAAFGSNLANFAVSGGDATGKMLLLVGATSSGHLLMFWHDVFRGRDPRHTWIISCFFGALFITCFICSAGGNTGGNAASLLCIAILYAFMFGFIWICSWALPERNDIGKASERDVEDATGAIAPQDSNSTDTAFIAEAGLGLTRLREPITSV